MDLPIITSSQNLNPTLFYFYLYFIFEIMYYLSLCLAYFRWLNVPQAHLCCCKWQDLIFVFNGRTSISVFVDRHLGCSSVLIFSNTAVLIGRQISLRDSGFLFFECILRSEVAWPCGCQPQGCWMVWNSEVFGFLADGIIPVNNCIQDSHSGRRPCT